nr:hypothetical protein HmN_000398000 [Hymenolepis microstoma]
MLESAESLSPFETHTSNSAVKLTTLHSNFYVSIIGNSSKDSACGTRHRMSAQCDLKVANLVQATGRDQISIPSRIRLIRSSNEGFDYPLIPFTSETGRCTSGNSLVKEKLIPDEWFGSLGVSRTSGQRMGYPLRHSDKEENDMDKSRLGQSMHETIPMVNQREGGEMDENETVGRQTPFNEGQPNFIYISIPSRSFRNIITSGLRLLLHSDANEHRELVPMCTPSNIEKKGALKNDKSLAAAPVLQELPFKTIKPQFPFHRPPVLFIVSALSKSPLDEIKYTSTNHRRFDFKNVPSKGFDDLNSTLYSPYFLQGTAKSSLVFSQ